MEIPIYTQQIYTKAFLHKSLRDVYYGVHLSALGLFLSLCFSFSCCTLVADSLLLVVARCCCCCILLCRVYRELCWSVFTSGSEVFFCCCWRSIHWRRPEHKHTPTEVKLLYIIFFCFCNNLFIFLLFSFFYLKKWEWKIGNMFNMLFNNW